MLRINAFLFGFILGFSLYGQDVVSILIDPGHGGKDPGHLPLEENGLQEKTLALEIALKIGKYLENNLQNVEVDYTRTDDSYPTLDDRVDMANNGDYHYMLSIHINGNPNYKVYGTETIIHNFSAKTSYKWGKLIEDQFKKRAGRKSRGVKTKEDLGHSVQILKYTKIPTIIVECGFITNPDESKYLSTIYGQEIIASAVFRGTREFLQFKHPDVDFILPPNQIAEEDSTYSTSKSYRVQIMSSIDPVDEDIPQFKNLGQKVERVKVDSQSLYKYKYYVGKYETKKEAKEVQKEVRESGFKDAFIVLV